MTHVLPQLPYAKDALKPVISAETIDYRNARPKYLDEIWKLVNWNFVAANFG